MENEHGKCTRDAAGQFAPGGHPDSAAGALAARRNLLFTVACEMPGPAVGAEDVLQETWPRRAGADLAAVRDQHA